MDKLPSDYVKKHKPNLKHEITELQKILKRQMAQQEIMVAQLDALLKVSELQSKTLNTGIFSISLMISILFVAHTLWG